MHAEDVLHWHKSPNLLGYAVYSIGRRRYSEYQTQQMCFYLLWMFPIKHLCTEIIPWFMECVCKNTYVSTWSNWRKFKDFIINSSAKYVLWMGEDIRCFWKKESRVLTCKWKLPICHRSSSKPHSSGVERQNELEQHVDIHLQPPIQTKKSRQCSCSERHLLTQNVSNDVLESWNDCPFYLLQMFRCILLDEGLN